MRSPLEGGRDWLEVEEVDSTQTLAAECLRNGSSVGVVFARHQRLGRGRFGRPWASSPDHSLTFSLIFHPYADHPRPHLIGMAVAVTAADVLDCGLQWPNDLVLGSRKLGGILTELMPDPHGSRVPIVGVGINLNQRAFPPELEPIATSLAQVRGGTYSPEAVARSIETTLAELPEPGSWSDLAPLWVRRDQTLGKRYRLGSGEEGVGLRVGAEGELLCQVGPEVRTVLAADAIFGK